MGSKPDHGFFLRGGPKNEVIFAILGSADSVFNFFPLEVAGDGGTALLAGLTSAVSSLTSILGSPTRISGLVKQSWMLDGKGGEA